MKRKWLGLALAAAMACAGAASAAEYTDSSVNYPEGWNDGSNGGTGFGTWQISANSGSGYAGGGIWETVKAEVSGDVVDANGNAFGIVGKGDGSSFTATRNFRAPLAVGDSFEFDMAVNWDCGYNSDSKKGIALFLDGKDAIVINHDAFPGPISVNGFWDNASLTNYGTGTMHWTILAKDETTVTVTGTARDGVSEPYSTDIELPSSALTGFRLQSALQKNDDETQEDADKRQSYFNNFKLTIAGELPELVTLGFSSGEWAVSNATQALSYTLTRSSSAGALDVTVSSSDEAFVAGKTVSFADGEAEISFTLDATLTGSGNYAKITASATGCDPATYEVRGPQYRLSVEKYEANPDETINFWMNWDDNGIALDEAKVTIEANPADSMDLPTEWTWNIEEGGAYVASSFVALSSGTLVLKYDGVQFADYGVTVVEAGATLSGPTSLRTGTTATYTADITLGSFEEGTFRLKADSGLVTIEPQEVVVTESGSISFQVTAGDDTGSVILTLEDDDGIAGEVEPITVTITEAPDYDDYIAYDDASLYTDGFDTAAVGEGTDKFQAWEVVTENSGGIFISDSAPDASILTEGKAFGIWANGADNAELQLRRPFVNSLGDGQAFSVVVSPEWRAGTKGVKFLGAWEGNWYERAEFFYNDYGYFYKLDGDADATSLDWEYGTDAITITLEKAADGSSYTLSFARGDDVVAKENITTFQGTVDGVQFYSYQGGEGTENNFVFNSLAIEQIAEPIKVRTIGIAGTWNMDAIGDYDFVVGPAEAGDPIGVVALSVTPDDGRVTISPASVEVPGDDVAAFTVTVAFLPEEGEAPTTYTIKATPADEAIPPAEFNVTPTQPYLTLSSEKWQHTTDEGTIWLSLEASPSFFGTYTITSENDSVLSVPEASASITVDEGQPKAWFDVSIVDVGNAKIFATLGEVTRDYGFEISRPPEPVEHVRITAISIADNEMTLTLDQAGKQVFAATEPENGVWKWQALDLAIIGDGTSVTVPMADPKMMYRVE